MGKPLYRYVNVSNPAAFGIEWTHPESGNAFQMVNIRGTDNLIMGFRPAGRTGWITTLVACPERFTDGQPITTYARFLAIVRHYAEV